LVLIPTRCAGPSIPTSTLLRVRRLALAGSYRISIKIAIFNVSPPFD
jgi:hypothetical protein